MKPKRRKTKRKSNKMKKIKIEGLMLLVVLFMSIFVSVVYHEGSSDMITGNAVAGMASSTAPAKQPAAKPPQYKVTGEVGNMVLYKGEEKIAEGYYISSYADGRYSVRLTRKADMILYNSKKEKIAEGYHVYGYDGGRYSVRANRKAKEILYSPDGKKIAEGYSVYGYADGRYSVQATSDAKKILYSPDGQTIAEGHYVSSHADGSYSVQATSTNPIFSYTSGGYRIDNLGDFLKSDGTKTRDKNQAARDPSNPATQAAPAAPSKTITFNSENRAWNPFIEDDAEFIYNENSLNVRFSGFFGSVTYTAEEIQDFWWVNSEIKQKAKELLAEQKAAPVTPAPPTPQTQKTDSAQDYESLAQDAEFLGLYDWAAKDYQTAAEKYQTSGDSYSAAYNYQLAAENYRRDGNYQAAAEVNELAAQIYFDKGYDDYAADSYDWAAENYRLDGNKDLAAENLVRSANLYDPYFDFEEANSRYIQAIKLYTQAGMTPKAKEISDYIDRSDATPAAPAAPPSTPATSAQAPVPEKPQPAAPAASAPAGQAPPATPAAPAEVTPAASPAGPPAPPPAPPATPAAPAVIRPRLGGIYQITLDGPVQGAPGETVYVIVEHIEAGLVYYQRVNEDGNQGSWPRNIRTSSLNDFIDFYTAADDLRASLVQETAKAPPPEKPPSQPAEQTIPVINLVDVPDKVTINSHGYLITFNGYYGEARIDGANYNLFVSDGGIYADVPLFSSWNPFSGEFWGVDTQVGNIGPDGKLVMDSNIQVTKDLQNAVVEIKPGQTFKGDYAYAGGLWNPVNWFVSRDTYTASSWYYDSEQKEITNSPTNQNGDQNVRVFSNDGQLVTGSYNPNNDANVFKPVPVLTSDSKQVFSAGTTSGGKPIYQIGEGDKSKEYFVEVKDDGTAVVYANTGIFGEKINSESAEAKAVLAADQRLARLPVEPGTTAEGTGYFFPDTYTATGSYMHKEPSPGEVGQINTKPSNNPTQDSRQIWSDKQGSMFYTRASGNSYKPLVLAQTGNTQITAGGTSWYGTQLLVDQNGNEYYRSGTNFYQRNIYGYDKPVSSEMESTLINAERAMNSLSLAPGTEVSESGLFSAPYVATTQYYPSSGPGELSGTQTAGSQQVFTQDGRNYVKDPTQSSGFREIPTATYKPQLGGRIDVYYEGQNWKTGNELYRINSDEYYYDANNRVIDRNTGKPVTDTNIRNAVDKASGRTSEPPPPAKQNQQDFFEDVGDYLEGVANVFYLNPANAAWAEHERINREMEEKEINQMREAEMSKLSFKLLNDILGPYAYDFISDYCTEETDSSELASGDSPKTVADQELPEVSAPEYQSATGDAVSINLCSGVSATIGSAQYSVGGIKAPYLYEYSWTLMACKQDITYSIFMNPGNRMITSGSLDKGENPQAGYSSFASPQIYSEMCIRTNDASFGANGIACFNPPNIPTEAQYEQNDSRCPTLTDFNINRSFDIVFAGNNYDNIDNLPRDAGNIVYDMMEQEAFLNYQTTNGINFMYVNDIFRAETMQNIQIYTQNLCSYALDIPKFIVVLDPSTEDCLQEGHTVMVNPLFRMNSTLIGDARFNEIINDFCSYITLIGPGEFRAVILNENATTVPGEVPIYFQIASNKYPVQYELLFNSISLVSSRAANISVKTHVLRIPSGNWFIQIKAKNEKGDETYSNVLNINTNDTMEVDFSSIGTVSIPRGTSVNIDLNSYLIDPRNEQISEWIHDPAFSNCVDFEPAEKITDGSVTLIASGAAGCEETIKFEAVTVSNRRASGTISLRIE